MTAATTNSYDTLIVGGGVIGLSLAWELTQHGESVCVVDRGQLGKEASWAGAGMVPAGPAKSHWQLATAYEQLEGLSQRLHPEWHQKLLAKTGIDSEFRPCGTLHLARNDAEESVLQKKILRWNELGIDCKPLDAQQIAELEPALESYAKKFIAGYHLREEAQLRNPRHLQALVSACEGEGVALRPGQGVERFESASSSLAAAITSDGPIYANRFCITAGCWSGQLAESIDLNLPIHPIRGQIVLLNGPAGLLSRNIYIGMKYFTPRLDGHLLVGSTLENAGFNKVNTPEAIAELTQLAHTIIPTTTQLPTEQTWAGLRPGTVDNLPYLGRVPNWENAWIATGHFRSGLQISPATAVVMRCLMRGEDSPIDVTSLGVERNINL